MHETCRQMVPADRIETVRDAADAGAEFAHRHFRTDIPIERKDGKTDLVTQVDRDAEAVVTEAIHETFPGEPVVGEESADGSGVPRDGPAWIVDPIDGTNNYLRGMRLWGTSVAAVVDGEPVAAATVCPALGDRYVADADGAERNGEPMAVSDLSDPETFSVAPTIWWDFDDREAYAAATRAIVTRFGDLLRFRCAQLELAQVAAGGLDGAITDVKAKPWDTVAGVYMIRQAGGRVTDIDGDPWELGATGIVASNGRCHEELQAAATAIRGD